MQVLDVVRTAYAGDTVGQAYQGNQVFNVITTLDAKDRANVSDVWNLPRRAPDGTLVPLRALADIYESNGRYQIQHQGGLRMASLTFNVVGASRRTIRAMSCSETATRRMSPQRKNRSKE